MAYDVLRAWQLWKWMDSRQRYLCAAYALPWSIRLLQCAGLGGRCADLGLAEEVLLRWATNLQNQG